MQRDRNTRGRAGKSKASEIYADSAQQRRARYATDQDTSDAARNASRERYHQQARPRSAQPARVEGGIRRHGEVREVFCEGMDHPVSVLSFTVPQAADALGRGVATIRRWLQADKMPAPYLEDVVHHHKVYSVGELEVIDRVIREHEREFVYLVSEHTHIVEGLHQAVHAYRAEFI